MSALASDDNDTALETLSDQEAVSSNISQQYNRYYKWISALAKIDKEFEWLKRFLEESSPRPCETKVSVVESIGGSLSIRKVKGKGNLSKLLKSNPEAEQASSTGIQTRIIIVTYPETWSIDRAKLVLLVLHFGIDPVHLFNHLFHDGSYMDTHCPKVDWKPDLGSTTSTPLLPSERKAWMELKAFSSESKLAAFLRVTPGDSVLQQPKQSRFVSIDPANTHSISLIAITRRC
jgi:hypothetical protein